VTTADVNDKGVEDEAVGRRRSHGDVPTQTERSMSIWTIFFFGIVALAIPLRLPLTFWTRVLSPCAFLTGVTVAALGLIVCFQNCNVPGSAGMQLHRMSLGSWGIAGGCFVAGVLQVLFATMLWRHGGTAVGRRSE
jgi:hypothetical protein